MSAREEVAGIIDPRAFQSWQGLYDYCLKDGENADFAKRCADAFHGEAVNEALAKADIIFARGVAATPTSLDKAEIASLLRKHLKIGGHDAWEGHYYHVAGIDTAAEALAVVVSRPMRGAE